MIAKRISGIFPRILNRILWAVMPIPDVRTKISISRNGINSSFIIDGFDLKKTLIDLQRDPITSIISVEYLD